MPHRRSAWCPTSSEINGLEAGWWAGQDSNLQPDRYERPALTIELPARQGAPQGRIKPKTRTEAMRWQAVALGSQPRRACLSQRRKPLFIGPNFAIEFVFLTVLW